MHIIFTDFPIFKFKVVYDMMPDSVHVGRIRDVFWFIITSEMLSSHKSLKLLLLY